eukprot:jgi/Antlo1/155/1702
MSTAAERLLTERKGMRKTRGYMMYARPVSENNKLNIMQWECGIPGTDMYTGGYFRIYLFFKQTYPFTPPVAQFVHPVYHPNVYENGTVCLDLLGDKWKPSLGIERVLYALQQLLANPNIRSPANRVASDEYENSKTRFARKVKENIKKYHSSHEWATE